MRDFMVILITLLLNTLTDCEAFECYSCSYTRSSDPKLSYECVTHPGDVTTGIPIMNCQAPYMCITKTLFNQDMSHIRSVTRVCQPQQEVCQGESCCNMNGVYPTCEHKCRSDKCNNGSPERWLKNQENGNDVTKDNGSGGKSQYGGVTLSCVLAVLVISNRLV